MALLGKEIEDLQSALVRAVSDLTELDAAVSIGLGVPLTEVVSGDATLRDAVFQVIRWADSRSRIEQLVIAVSSRMRAFPLVVLKSGAEHKRGTAWILEDRGVVTAFHVVGTSGRYAWDSDLDDTVEYLLEVPGRPPLRLDAVVGDGANDVALLIPRGGPDALAGSRLRLGARPEGGAGWRALGRPSALDARCVALAGTISTVGNVESRHALRLAVEQPERWPLPVMWNGCAGAPVLAAERDEVLGMLTSPAGESNALWACSSDAVHGLLKWHEELSRFGRELTALLSAAYSDTDELRRLAEDLGIKAAGGPGLAAQMVTCTLRAGPPAVDRVLREVRRDRPELLDVGRLQSELSAVTGRQARRLTRTDKVDRILQVLDDRVSSGVALLEPLGFGAAGVLTMVEQEISDRKGPAAPVVVHLIPDRRQLDEAVLFEILLRGLRNGLRHALRGSFEPEWSRAVEYAPPASEQKFEQALDRILSGPAETTRRRLVLAIDGIDRIDRVQLESWGAVLGRLCSQYRERFRVIVRGGEELHRLCNAPYDRSVQQSSVFNDLKQVKLGPLVQRDLERLLDGSSDQGAVERLLKVTGGHPALVRELLRGDEEAALAASEEDLRARLEGSVHASSLGQIVSREQDTVRALGTLLDGGTVRRTDRGVERLVWLGVLIETGATRWEWAAPIMREWAAAWLGR